MEKIRSIEVMDSFDMKGLSYTELLEIEGGESCSNKKICVVYCDNYTPCNHIPGEGCKMWGMAL